MELRSLSNTIKENLVYDVVKYGVLAAGSLMIAAATYVVHKWLPTHDIIAACIVLVVAIVAFAWLTRQLARGNIVKRGSGLIVEAHGTVTDPPPRPVSLPDRIVEACKKLSVFITEQGIRPDENEIFNQTTTFDNQGVEYTRRCQEVIVPWDNKIAAGYYLRFKEPMVALRHELVLALAGCSDDQLDDALTHADRLPDNNYAQHLRTIVERMRYLASKIG